MKAQIYSKIALLIVFFIVASSHAFGQNTEITVEQDEKFNTLLREKVKSNVALNTNDRYRIQIFSGDNANSRKLLSDFKQNNPEVDATIIFQTPNYKVLIGSFFNRIEAHKFLQKIKPIYPNSFIIKPSKS